MQGIESGQLHHNEHADNERAGAPDGARQRGGGQVEREVRAFLAENFILDDSADELPADASLTERGVLDSMGVLELIMFIEERYGFKVPDEDTVPENLDSVERIVAYVTSRRSN